MNTSLKRQLLAGIASWIALGVANPALAAGLGPNGSIPGTGSGSVSVTSTCPSLVVNPSPGTGTFTVGPNVSISARTTTTEAISTSDICKLVTFGNASATAVSLPQAGTTGYEAGKTFGVQVVGAGTATITPAGGSLINGASTLAITTGKGGNFTSNGTDWVPSECTACASGSTTFANPTATASDTATNGSSTNAMRADASPAVQKGTNSVFGVVKGDTTTITCVVGVCSTVGGGSGANYMLGAGTGASVAAGGNKLDTPLGNGNSCGVTSGALCTVQSAHAITVSNLQVVVTTTPITAGATFSLATFATATTTDTTLTCTVGVGATTCSDVTHTPTISANALWGMHINDASDTAVTGVTSWSFDVTF